MELTNREWEPFVLDDLFEIFTGGDLIISRIQKGEIPIISHSKENNGIADWTISIDKQILFNANDTISLADRGNFYAFTQQLNFYIGTRVKALKAKFLNPNKFLLQFICTQINKQSVKFSYGNNATGGIGKLKILLPITSKGEPDYAFMENYMREKETELLKQYKKQVSKFESFIPLSEKEWNEFEIGKLFKISVGKSKGLNHLQNVTKGGINYLGATNSNNGVLAYVQKVESLTHRGNSICFIRNGEGSMGFSVYKAEDFIATSDISVGYTDFINKYVGLFITTVADKVRGKYNFGYKRNETRLKKEKILLPINSQGKPDYVYMENYMRALESKKIAQYLEYKKQNTHN